MTDSTDALAASLGLQRWGERGWWSTETWVAPTPVTLPDGSVRPTASTSLVLMPAGESARWHRSVHDQVWFAHSGVVVIRYGGRDEAPVAGRTVTLSTDVGTGRVAQVALPGGEWHRLLAGTGDALLGFMSSPGFDASDLEVVDD